MHAKYVDTKMYNSNIIMLLKLGISSYTIVNNLGTDWVNENMYFLIKYIQNINYSFKIYLLVFTYITQKNFLLSNIININP
jgi:hypothetical protein